MDVSSRDVPIHWACSRGTNGLSAKFEEISRCIAQSLYLTGRPNDSRRSRHPLCHFRELLVIQYEKKSGVLHGSREWNQLECLCQSQSSVWTIGRSGVSFGSPISRLLSPGRLGRHFMYGWDTISFVVAAFLSGTGWSTYECERALILISTISWDPDPCRTQHGNGG